MSSLVCSLLFSSYFFLCVFLFFDWEPYVSQGLGNYKSRPHYPKGPKGVAKQAAQKEATDARKKKTKVAHQKYKKEKEVAQRVKAR